MRTGVISMNQPLLFRTVAGRQSNHEGFYMPPGIRHLGTLSLYRAVVWWGLFLGREFTRDDVSEAFSIEPRRASGILNYICNRHNDDDICFDSRLHPVRGGRAQLVVRIRAVESRPDTIRRQRTDRPGGKVSDRQYDRQMAHWLLSRPAGGDTAKLAAWQAACPVREASC
ncbi:CaiF/GrlA family transcriptional regulator [Salmonella enterica]|nr:CaiF/GrlA family transcriptional regulator [Salmonella enterica]EGW2410547.1 CaiF/GrlA family transcriptional regulator [Salmonella enterica]